MYLETKVVWIILKRVIKGFWFWIRFWVSLSRKVDCVNLEYMQLRTARVGCDKNKRKEMVGLLGVLGCTMHTHGLAWGLGRKTESVCLFVMSFYCFFKRNGKHMNSNPNKQTNLSIHSPALSRLSTIFFSFYPQSISSLFIFYLAKLS